MTVKIKLLFLSLFILVFCGCKSRKSAVDSFQDSKITLERTPCYGTCPVYKFEINGTGESKLENIRFVEPIDTLFGQADSASIQQLFSEFANTDWSKFKNTYDANVTDLPTIYLAWYHCGTVKKIKIRYNYPEELVVLIKKVDQVKNNIAWSVPEN